MYHFTVENEEELNSLWFLACRYDSAQLLYYCVHDEDFDLQYPIKVDVPEHVAWEILDATEEDGGCRGMVPCLGGRLGDEIHKMLDSVI